MIPAPYNTWPVVMSRNKAAQLWASTARHWRKTSNYWIGALKKSGTSQK